MARTLQKRSKKQKMQKAVRMNASVIKRVNCKIALNALATHVNNKKISRRKQMMAEKYHSDLMKIKIIEGLKHYVFVKRRAKKIAKFRSVMTWAKKTKFKTFICLKANCRMRQEKKKRIA